MALYNTDIEAVSTYHIADKQLYQPAVSNAFTFIVNPNLSKLLYAGIDRSTVDEADAGDDNYLNNVDDTIRLSVVSGKIPHFTLEPIEIRRGNSKLTYAGLPSFDNEELTLHDFVGARTKDEIAVMALRGGDIVGRHTVGFYNDGEFLELNHTATARNTFSKGALKVAKWIVNKDASLYSINDALGL